MANDTNDNYYHVLNIGDDATLEEIKKAYRRLAVQFHPDKNPTSPQAGERFKILSRAYNVLSSPVQRSRYDNQMKLGRSGQYGSGHNSWSDFDEDPRKTFETLFKDYFPFHVDDDDFRSTHERTTKTAKFNQSNNVRMHKESQEQNSSQNYEVNQGGCKFNGNKRKPNENQGYSDVGNRDTPPSSKRTRHEQSANSETPKDPAIERPLEISLEELSTGCTKKLKIKRTINSETGGSMIDSKLIEIPVKPGWKAGTRITYPEVGDRNPGSIPADITFIVTDKPHALFSRDSDNNLLHKAKISLKTALLGVSYCIQGLNGKRHDVNVKDIIHPGYMKRYAGEGLPLPKTPSKCGDLIVTFDIEFPGYLSWDQRRKLSDCLP